MVDNDAHVVQLAERAICNRQVIGSIPVMSFWNSKSMHKSCHPLIGE